LELAENYLSNSRNQESQDLLTDLYILNKNYQNGEYSAKREDSKLKNNFIQTAENFGNKTIQKANEKSA